MNDRPEQPFRNDRLIEEDASALYDEAPCGYLYSHPDGTLVRVNRTFLDWTGFERPELVGRRFQDMLSVGGRIFYETHLAPLLHMQGFVTEVALDVITKGGAHLPVLVNAVLKRDAHGTPLLVRTTVFNATDRKRYERELQVARARAEESARAKSELLSTISHDIRSPLGAILAAAQLLERSPLTPAQKNYVRVLRSSSESLLGLVNNVLDLSRINSGRTALERRPFDLRQLLLDVMAGLNVGAEAKQLTLRAEIDDALPDAVIGDPVKVGQIITNLASNAVKFTERGSVVLSVRVTGRREDRIEVAFRVADTGIGIPAERLPHIFDEFTQASYDVAATYGGSGLGLAIVRRLIELHGSRIQVDSTVSQGTSFSFDLTFGVVAADRETAPGAADGELTARAELLRGLRVLLVEDNAFDAFLVGRALAAWGVAHEVAASLAQAVERLRAGKYGAVLLAISPQHPEAESAIRTVREIATASGYEPQVLMLARTVPDPASPGGAAAVVVPKPVDPNVLFAKLATSREARSGNTG